MKSASIWQIMAMFFILVDSYYVSLCTASTVTAEEDGGEEEKRKTPFHFPSVFLRSDSRVCTRAGQFNVCTFDNLYRKGMLLDGLAQVVL